MTKAKISPELEALATQSYEADYAAEDSALMAAFDLDNAKVVHDRIVQDVQMVNISLGSLCRDLKEFKDNEYYKPLGYESFGAYTEREHGIGERQAYKYVRIYEKLGDEFLNSSSKIGITKLNALAALDSAEREELLSEHGVDDLAEMPVDEVTALTRKVKELEEQVDTLQNAEPVLSAEERAVLETAVKDELESKYAKEITDLTRKLEIERGERANAEAESDDLSDELFEAKSKIYGLQNSLKLLNFSDYDLAIAELRVLNFVCSDLFYNGHFRKLNGVEKDTFLRELYGYVERYFGPKPEATK